MLWGKKRAAVAQAWIRAPPEPGVVLQELRRKGMVGLLIIHIQPAMHRVGLTPAQVAAARRSHALVVSPPLRKQPPHTHTHTRAQSKIAE